MLIVGELINASRKAIRAAIEAKDADTIQKAAKLQKDAGADFIDVNAGIFADQEAQLLTWLTETVQAAVDVPCCLDSPNPMAIEAALGAHQGSAMINSISLEKERWDKLLPVVCGKAKVKVVGLCISDDGMPETADQRVAIAEKLIEGLTKQGIALGDIYVDPLVQPVSVDASYGPAFLTAIERITIEFPGVHTICGLSNVSYGLPKRKLINRTFMSMAIGRGLDSAIVDPADNAMMATIYAAEAMAGCDDFCANYLAAFRSGRLEA